MPSFDITSEVDLVSLRNAVESANRKIGGRYDFKGSDCRVEQGEKLLTLFADTEFQLEQMKGILLPEMTSKKIDIRCPSTGISRRLAATRSAGAREGWRGAGSGKDHR